MIPSKHLCIALQLALFTIGCHPGTPAGRAKQAGAGAVKSTTKSFAWDGCPGFDWLDHPVLGPRAAMVVTATIEGLPAPLQLDTGLDATVLYGTAWAKEAGLEIRQQGSRRFVTADIRVGEITFEDHEITIMAHEAGDTVGSLGLDVVIGHVLAIHFERGRVCLLDEVPTALSSATQFSEARIEGQRFFLELNIGERTYGHMFYDTGASVIPLAVDRTVWREMTGSGGDDVPLRRIRVPQWGKNVTLIGAPTVAAVRLAGRPLGRLHAYYIREHPELFATQPTRTVGLIGNQPFFGGWVVVDGDEDAPRFGSGPRAGTNTRP